MPLTFAAASSATARPAVADGMPRSWASGMRCVSTKPVVVMPQTKNGAASSQNPRERARPRSPTAGAPLVGSATPRAGGAPPRRAAPPGGGGPADRLEADVLGAIADPPPQHRRDDGREQPGAGE